MRVRLLLAAGVLSFVPAFVRAQDVPAAAPAPTAPIVAQRGGSWEFSLGGGLTLVAKGFRDYFGTSTTRILNAGSGPAMVGGQLRATWNVSSHLGLGVGIVMANGVKFASDNGAMLLAPFGALTYTVDLDRGFSPYIEVGGGYTQVSSYTGSLLPRATDGKTSAPSIFGGLGVRTMISRALALRVEGRMAIEKFTGPSSSARNVTMTVGLSYFLGGKRPSDADGDGVPDRSDACPDTPAGAIVDAQGCALDSDRDGVYDGLDQCADTPEGATVDAIGCALDTDRDGVYDGLDRCPDTPAGVVVDATGCPRQEAPPPAPAAAAPAVVPAPVPAAVPAPVPAAVPAPVPAPVAAAVPAPAPAPAPSLPATMVVRNITYRTFQQRIAVAPNAELDGIATALRNTPDARWEIAGYTDSRGIPAGNLRLSQRRATAVMQYLVRKGVPPTSLTAVGYGAQNPVASNATLAGRVQNRRIEIRRLP